MGRKSTLAEKQMLAREIVEEVRGNFSRGSTHCFILRNALAHKLNYSELSILAAMLSTSKVKREDRNNI